MKYPDNIEHVAALQPDYLGFIFYEKSARYFDGDIPKLTNAIKKVGVFVDAPQEDVLEKIKTHHLLAVQLHGDESPEYCKTLKRHFEDFQFELSEEHNDEKLEIIKVFSIKDNFDFNLLKPYESVCDFYLFDTKGKLPGGNGYTFDWSVLKNYPSTKPYFLSGGIGLEEIETIESFLVKEESKYCYAIDVNSKFEIEPGLKNIVLLKEFKNNVIKINEK